MIKSLKVQNLKSLKIKKTLTLQTFIDDDRLFSNKQHTKFAESLKMNFKVQSDICKKLEFGHLKNSIAMKLLMKWKIYTHRVSGAIANGACLAVNALPRIISPNLFHKLRRIIQTRRVCYILNRKVNNLSQLTV